MNHNWFDIRGNYYSPVGNDRKALGFSAVSNTPTFTGNDVQFGRTRIDEVANEGYDLEVSVPIPGEFFTSYNVRAGGGYYEFEDPDGVEFDGGRARLQGQVFPNLVAQVMVTEDDTFGTNWMFSVAWEFSRFASEETLGARRVHDKLGDFVERNSNVVVTRTVAADPISASLTVTDANGMPVPLSLIHINSNAAANGDGSLAAPFQTLTDATSSANAGPGSIFYAHADSVFDNESITLMANQRLLGEGLDYTIDTNMGTVTLPRATNGVAAPVIQQSPAGIAAVTVANDSEISNFQIRQDTDAAILADGVSGTVRIANNSVSDTFRGIDIRNSSAAFTLQDNSIANTIDSGVELTDNATEATIAFTGTTTIDRPGEPLLNPAQPNGGIGIVIEGGSAQHTFEEIIVTNRTSTAIGIGHLGTGGTATFNQALTIDNPQGSPDEAIGVTNSAGNVTFGDVTITDSNRAILGQPQVLLSNNSNTVAFNNLNISSTNGGGLSAINIGRLNIIDGTIDVSGGTGAEINGATETNIVFESISASNTDLGIRIGRTEGGSFLVSGIDGQPDSGGTLDVNVVGIALSDSISTTFNNMLITSGNSGLAARNSNDVVLSNSRLFGTADDYTGVFVRNIANEPKDGTPVILTSNTITSNNSNVIGIYFENLEAELGDLRLDNQVINLTGSPSLGIELRAIDIVEPGQLDNDGPGDFVLSSNQANTVTAENVAVDTQTNANIFGQAIINGTLFP